MIWITIVDHKNKEALSDLMPELSQKFPGEVFYLHGSEEKGYQLRLEGAGDEKAPRAFSEKFLKTWKPKLVEPTPDPEKEETK